MNYFTQKEPGCYSVIINLLRLYKTDLGNGANLLI